MGTGCRPIHVALSHDIRGMKNLENLNVLLINPAPFPSPLIFPEKLPPLGLAYLAAVLEREDINVKILDNFLFEKPLEFVKREALLFNPKVVGITCNTMVYQTCLQTAKAIKEVLPSTLVVVGGPHATLFPNLMLKCKEIDVVVLGEGEYIFRGLVLNVFRGKKLCDIAGLMCREGDKIATTGKSHYISNLNDLPFPARHLLPMEKYQHRSDFLTVEPIMSMNTSRGCPFSCAFCSSNIIWGRSYRSFSPVRIVNEIEHLVEVYGARGIYFREDNFTANRERVVGICREIMQRRLDVEWVCESRVDQISRELLREMRQAGCKSIWFGVESGSQRVLDYLRKGITVESSRKAFSLCKDEGIRTGASFMIGIPSETFQEMDMTFRLAEALDPDWCWFNVFIGIPGSEVYNQIIKEGLFDYVDENGIARIKTDLFDSSIIQRVRSRMLVKYHIRPKRIIRTATRYNWSEYPFLLRQIVQMLAWAL